ncbi:hypothetical protein HK105_202220 [Polyrhizophydium stewartii]|uniref:Uncharacterized protein n=1 Tax=Polyrhizophydium stewartii TaxID=2732419 RepID=A0ABR4NFJ8_9FUNG
MHLALPDVQWLAATCRSLRSSLRDPHVGKRVLQRQASALSGAVTIQTSISGLDQLEFGVDARGGVLLLHQRPDLDTSVYRIGVKLSGRVEVVWSELGPNERCIGGLRTHHRRGRATSASTSASASASASAPGEPRGAYAAAPADDPYDRGTFGASDGVLDGHLGADGTRRSLPSHVLTPHRGGIPVPREHAQSCPRCGKVGLVRLGPKVNKNYRVFYQTWRDAFNFELQFGSSLLVEIVHDGNHGDSTAPGTDGQCEDMSLLDAHNAPADRAGPSLLAPPASWSWAAPRFEHGRATILVEVARYDMVVRPEDVGWIEVFWGFGARGRAAAATVAAASAGPADPLSRASATGTTVGASPAAAGAPLMPDPALVPLRDRNGVFLITHASALVRAPTQHVASPDSALAAAPPQPLYNPWA